jgi:hypothetical protein
MVAIYGPVVQHMRQSYSKPYGNNHIYRYRHQCCGMS